MNHDVSVHLSSGEVRAHAIDADPPFDILRMRDASEPSGLSGVDIFIGHDDAETAEVALQLIEAIGTIRERALRRMALRESADPITAAKAEEDRLDEASELLAADNYRAQMLDAERSCADCGGDHPSGHPWHTPPAHPLTAAKARYDAMTSGPSNMDVEPDGNEPDGPGDAYWQSGGPAHESETYRRDLEESGRGAMLRG